MEALFMNCEALLCLWVLAVASFPRGSIIPLILETRPQLLW
jgi:hypothetical protein